jgi:hypothetical protein
MLIMGGLFIFFVLFARGGLGGLFEKLLKMRPARGKKN